MKKFRVEIRITTYDDLIVDAVDEHEAHMIAAEEHGDGDNVEIAVFEIKGDGR